jgi:hypothetical protein
MENFGSVDIFQKTMVKPKYDEKFLSKGTLPVHIQDMMAKLTTAFKKNVNQKSCCAADLGHYIADAHNTLHTQTIDGQNRSKEIHSLWESRLPVVCEKL